jgi:hypothetical protein
MIQFNLLPDVKLEFMKAERTKRLVVAISTAVTIVTVAILVILLMVVLVFQKKYMNDLSADIATYSKDLQATPDLNKILTVQNQLKSLTTLHQEKPDATRIFPYIKEITPLQVSLATLTIDFDAGTFTITGSAISLSDVNKFVDTLKFTEYTKDKETNRAFSEVVLASFGRADKGASYTINLKFDPVIFSNTEKVKLTVPVKITTRSETEKPTALFEPVTNSKGQ